MYFGEEEGGCAGFVGFAAEGLSLFEVVGHGGLGAHLSDCLGVVSMSYCRFVETVHIYSWVLS